MLYFLNLFFKYAQSFILYCFLCLVLSGNYLLAKDRDLKLGWKSVAGNNGYQLEVKGENNYSRAFKFDFNEALISLPPGKYTVRVAVLNKFKKPAKFSEWKNIEIDDSSRVQEFDLAAQEKEIKRKETKIESENIPLWKIFIPGLVQWKTTPNKSILFWISIGGVLTYNYQEKTRGDTLADRFRNQQNYILGTFFISPRVMGPYALYQRSEDRRMYDIHQERQRRGGMLLGAVYALSILDAYLLRKELTKGLEMSLRMESNLRRSDFFLSFDFSF
jgi:hypothetical protein